MKASKVISALENRRRRREKGGGGVKPDCCRERGAKWQVTGECRSQVDVHRARLFKLHSLYSMQTALWIRRLGCDMCGCMSVHTVCVTGETEG